MYKFLWRDKGDTLSRQYTGTDSTISRVSEDLKEGAWGKFAHKVVAMKRIVQNTIYENSDQEIIDVILGKYGETKADFNVNSKV